MRPIPPSWMRKIITIWPKKLNSLPVSHTARPVTQEAEVAVNAPHSRGLGEDIYLVDFEPADDDGNVDACLMMVAAQLLNPDYKCPLVVGKAFEGDVASHGLHEIAT